MDRFEPSRSVKGPATRLDCKARFDVGYQVLLRWLGFQLCVDHPYRYVLNFANALRCSASHLTPIDPLHHVIAKRAVH